MLNTPLEVHVSTLVATGVGVLILFFEMALYVGRNSKRAENAIFAVYRQEDRLQQKWLFVLMGVLTGVVWSFYPWGHYDIRDWGYLLVFIPVVLGITVRIWAIRTLGAYFTVDITTFRCHKVHHDGPYWYVRHPSYSGLILMMLGLAISLQNWVSFVWVMFPLLLVLDHRARTEERFLEEKLGQPYTWFCYQRKRFFPGVY